MIKSSLKFTCIHVGDVKSQQHFSDKNIGMIRVNPWTFQELLTDFLTGIHEKY